MNKCYFSLLCTLVWGLFGGISPAIAHPQSQEIDYKSTLWEDHYSPLVNPARGDLRFAVISDLNGPYGSVTYDPEVALAIELMPFWQPDLVVTAGDMIAGQKRSLTSEEIEAMWQSFDQTILGPLQELEIPFGLTMGNHDGSAALRGLDYVFAQERMIAQRYWQNQRDTAAIEIIDDYNFPFSYTFHQGDAFFLVWDSSSHLMNSEDLLWIEQSLASEPAQTSKIRFVLGHLPLYGIAIGRDKPGEVLLHPEKLRALLEQYDVHTYISGHHHAYYPGQRAELNLLHAGALGGGPRRLISGDVPPTKTLTIVDIFWDGDTPFTNYTTYDLKTLAIIPPDHLPRSLFGHNGMVIRQDLELEHLTKEELAACEQQLAAHLCGW